MCSSRSGRSTGSPSDRARSLHADARATTVAPVPDRSPDTTVDDLAELLEVPPGQVAFLSSLDEADLARLHRVVSDSLEREAAAIDEALQATMRFLPRPLRGRARKMLFPDEEGSR